MAIAAVSRETFRGLFFGLLLVGALACGAPSESPPASEGAGGARAERPVADSAESLADEKTMAEIAALGYANWDEGADTELRGAVQHDPAGTAPGYNFYSDHADGVFLVDLAGEIVHRWKLPDTERSLFAELLEDGSIVASLGPERLALVDRDSRLVWELPLHAHHDVAVSPDGSLFVLTSRWIYYQGRRVLFDGIAHVSADGKLLDQWWTFDWLADLQRHHPLRALDYPPDPKGKEAMVRRDYYHANSIEVLPDTPLGREDRRFRAGNLLVCLHQVNLVIVLDQDDYSVTWSWGADELDWPHMPTMLPNGHILVFDNGSHRDYSRVLEIEPPSGEIVWKYEADPPQAFYTQFRGCNERLPNGNTLICESERGHVFEVTGEGRIVWEYWNPIFEKGNHRRRISRFTRYPAEYVAPLLGSPAGGD